MRIKIFFIGSLFSGSTAVHRLNATKHIFTQVNSIDQQIIINSSVRLLDRLLNKTVKYTCNSVILNRKILAEVLNNMPEIIWIDKGLQVAPETLIKIRAKLPGTKIIHYSPDDMINPSNQSKYYLKCIPLYHLHVTTKSYNVPELKDLGAQKVMFVNNAYAPEIHKPYILNNEEKEKYSSDVSFIGGPEKQRSESINFLADNGIKIKVWGNGWSKFLKLHPNIKIEQGWFADEAYSKIICASKINLAFLRKVNRDLQTTRTMEIPACGGFMLAERTDEHLNLFKEDEEAVYFSDDNELKIKIEYYLKNENERTKIAASGLKRCIESHYDNITMVKNILRYL